MLKPKRRRSIESAISNEVAPTRSKSHDLLLRLGGNKYAKLQTRGQTTPAGRFYFSQTNSTPETYDINGTVVQRGSSEYLLLCGKAMLLRRLASGNAYIYTRLGKTYYSQRESALPRACPNCHKKGPYQQQRSGVPSAAHCLHVFC